MNAFLSPQDGKARETEKTNRKKRERIKTNRKGRKKINKEKGLIYSLSFYTLIIPIVYVLKCWKMGKILFFQIRYAKHLNIQNPKYKL